jgi:hypothetical protein
VGTWVDAYNREIWMLVMNILEEVYRSKLGGYLSISIPTTLKEVEVFLLLLDLPW